MITWTGESVSLPLSCGHRTQTRRGHTGEESARDVKDKETKKERQTERGTETEIKTHIQTNRHAQRQKLRRAQRTTVFGPRRRENGRGLLVDRQSMIDFIVPAPV